jgi:hypothetical protein
VKKCDFCAFCYFEGVKIVDFLFFDEIMAIAIPNVFCYNI